MTLAQLRYYQAVCKYNNISKASESLHISQPAVSIAISNLESEFGVPLFIRDNRTLKMTDAGRVFLSLTEDLLANVDTMYRQMQMIQSKTSQLRLSVVPFSFSQMFRALLHEYRMRSPEVQVQVVECNAQEAVQKIKSSTIDVALTIDLMDIPSYVEGLRLFKVPSVFVVDKEHPMANMTCCCFADLAQQSLVFTKEDSFLTRQIKNRFQELGIVPKVFLYTAQSNMIETALQHGQNGAIISETLARQLQNVILIPIQDPVEITHLLIWKRATHLSPAITKFIKAIRSFYPGATPY